MKTKNEQKSGVQFAVYDTPDPRNRKTAVRPHARVLPVGTKRIGDICKFINDISSLSHADVKGVLEALFQYVSLELASGSNVEIENFGHFSVALRSREVSDGKGETKGQVEIGGVNFRCSPRLKKYLLQEATLIKEKRHTTPFPDRETRKERLLAYLETHPHINKSYYAELNGCSRYCADNDIRAFVLEGLLVASGVGAYCVYLPAE